MPNPVFTKAALNPTGSLWTPPEKLSAFSAESEPMTLGGSRTDQTQHWKQVMTLDNLVQVMELRPAVVVNGVIRAQTAKSE